MEIIPDRITPNQVTKGGRVGLSHKKNYWDDKYGNEYRLLARKALKRGDTQECKNMMRQFRILAWGRRPGEPFEDEVLIIARKLKKLTETSTKDHIHTCEHYEPKKQKGATCLK